MKADKQCLGFTGVEVSMLVQDVQEELAAILSDVPYSRDLERLILASQLLSSARSVQGIANIVKRTARRITHADGASFILRDYDQSVHFDEYAIAPLWKGQRIALENCLGGWTMKHCCPAVIPNVAEDWRSECKSYEDTFVKSVVMMPVRTYEPVAAVGVYWATPHVASETEVSLLQALADSIAIALENMQVMRDLEAHVMLRTRELKTANEELRRSNARLQMAQDEIQELEKLVRMCAWTNRLEYHGEWISIEDYLERRFGLYVSHGISEEAVAHLHAEFAGRKPLKTS
jgi:GAF domain-containing protein